MANEKDWVDILTALLTPTIAVLGIGIAYLQWRLNDLKYNHELYDRRLAVYKTLRQLLKNSATADYDTVMIIFDSITESYFLFDEDISIYLEEIWDNTTKIAGLNESSKDDTYLYADEKSELRQWFYAQYEVSKQKFMPYLKIYKKENIFSKYIKNFLE